MSIDIHICTLCNTCIVFTILRTFYPAIYPPFLGIYFNPPTIANALANPAQAKFIDREVLKRFERFGGCRLEDDILVTANGCENLSGDWPTTVEEIKEVMKN